MVLNASLHIQGSSRNGKTILQKSFCTPPFKIADITEDRSNGQLKLMLMSSSPGMLDGDVYEMNVEVDEDCSLHMTTQSYQRLFNMKIGAMQRFDVRLCKGSSFIYLPHPSVPHEGSNYSAVNKIYLKDKCTLILGEIISCGRKLNGEVFRFSEYRSTTQIFINNRLRVKENLLIRPAAIDIMSIGNMEGYTHQATLMYVNENIALPELSQTLDLCLASESDIAYGITALPVNGLLVRILGRKGEQLFDCVKQLAAQMETASVKNHPSPKTVYAG